MSAILTLTPPPEITGNYKKDIYSLNQWCLDFFIQIKRILYTYDFDNGSSTE